MYEPLLSQVNESRKRSAIFYKADLHIHSHESHDFPCLGDKVGCASEITDADKAATPGCFIGTAKDAGLDLIAITDHNRSKIAVDIAELGADKPVVLPGMEVSLKTTFLPDSTVHVLVLFPEKHGHGDIERIFASTNMPLYADRTTDSVVEVQVPEFIQSVHNAGGICIASHVNSNKGVRNLFRASNTKLLKVELRRNELSLRKRKGQLSEQETEELESIEASRRELEDETQNRYLKFLTEYRFDAIEVHNGEDRQFYTGTHVDSLGIRPICCVVGSDAHNLSDIGLENCTTYIKMTKPGFADLKKALRDPGTRIRFEHDVPRPRIARILGVQFEGGFFGDNTLGFSDNLTCLIGGRGSGKSAVVEALRYVFGQSLTHLPISKKKDISDRLDHTLQDTDIKVVFEDHAGDRYVIKRRYGENRTLCFGLDGTPHQDMDVAVAENLRVKIFGWGEIEELARNKRDQLNLIDGFVPDVTQAKQTVVDMMPTLRENTDSVVALAQEIKDLLPRVVELPTKKEMLERLSTPELDEVFREYDSNQAALGAVETVRSAVTAISRNLTQSDGTTYPLKTRLETALASIEEKLKAREWFADFQNRFKTKADLIEKAYLTVIQEVRALDSLMGEAKDKLGAELAGIEKELNASNEEVEASDVKSQRSRRKTLAEEVNSLQSIQDQIDQKQQQIKDLLKDRWARIIPGLDKARENVTELRNKKLVGLNDQLKELSSTVKVSISLCHQEDRHEFAHALGTGDSDGLLKHVYKFYIRDKFAERYAQLHSPHTFVQAILDDADADCSKLRIVVTEDDGSRTEIVNTDRARAVKKHLHPCIEESTYYDPAKLSALLELEHIATEDLPQISLDETPIEELSPGQRCSALIPIILLESDCPLVIDQPEDNLDNKLVFGLVVDIIRALKEQRQIIVATHNPNVPVSGDAEQIAVFCASTRSSCESIAQGSVDCDDIVGHVKAIMEGSEEAFRIRAEKYGYSQQ